MLIRFSLALILVVPSGWAAPPIGVCPGGSALASFDLGVLPDGESEAVGIRALTRLEGGARIQYSPRELFGANGDARVALISIPTTPTGVLAVMEARKASEPAEWVIPSRAAAVARLISMATAASPPLTPYREIRR